MPRWIVALLAAALSTGWMLAQPPAGQACLRAFEDRNANGVYDADEPLITRDVGAALADASGLIVQTALLDDSPRAAQGIVCFSGLADGQYTISVASAAFQPTTSPLFVVVVSQSSAPSVIDVGAQIISAALPENSPTRETGFTAAQLERIAVAAAAGGLVSFLMIIFGWILSALLLRRPQQPPYNLSYTGPYPVYFDTGRMGPVTAYPPRPDTGAMPPVPPYGQPPYAPPYTPPPPPPSSSYAPPPYEDDDTGALKRV